MMGLELGNLNGTSNPVDWDDLEDSSKNQNGANFALENGDAWRNLYDSNTKMKGNVSDSDD